MLTGRLFRWSQILADFDLEEISYIPGEQNVVADYLSRPGDSSVIEEHKQLQEEIELRADLVNLDPTLLCVIRSEFWKPGEMHEQTVHVNSLTQDNLLADDIKKNYDGDKYFAQILQDLRQNNLVSMQVRSYMLRDGFLFFTDSSRRQRICIPYHTRSKFLRLIHDDSCHVLFGLPWFGT